MRLDQVDDRFELLGSLSAAVFLSAADFMFDFGWDGDRFREALIGIRKMRIRLIVTEGGESVKIRRTCARTARAAAKGYFDRIYGNQRAA